MLVHNGNVITRNGDWLKHVVHLPPYTLRLRFKDGITPSNHNGKGTLTQVSASPNVWDWTYINPNWEIGWWHDDSNLLEVLGGNTSNVTNMKQMFDDCPSLTTVQLFDTSNVTNMAYMFRGCSALTSVALLNTSNVTVMDSMFEGCASLKSVPLFDTLNVTSMYRMFYECYALTTVPLLDTSKVTNMNYMFRACYNVESGALALYQQASTQTTPPHYHSYAFQNCGRDTTTGAAELAQIPSDWK